MTNDKCHDIIQLKSNMRGSICFMKNRKISAVISLVICCAASLLLVVWLFTFPTFFNWFYVIYHGLGSEYTRTHEVIKIVVPTFYCCAPFAGASLFMLIRLLLNILQDKVYENSNVNYLRFISYCCYACFIITIITGVKYFPLLIIAFAMVVVGTLLRVVKNVMQTAVEIKAENDLTV